MSESASLWALSCPGFTLGVWPLWRKATEAPKLISSWVPGPGPTLVLFMKQFQKTESNTAGKQGLLEIVPGLLAARLLAILFQGVAKNLLGYV